MRSPFLVDAVGRPRQDIPAQDAVAQQAKAAQVREARPLGQPSEDREVKRRAQAGHRQVNVDPLLEPGPGHGVAEPTARFAAEQRLEPAGVKADRHDDQVRTSMTDRLWDLPSRLLTTEAAVSPVPMTQAFMAMCPLSQGPAS
jgi:hypothetical protein